MIETTDAEAAALRRHFLGWQCRLRQQVVRTARGRPSSGMQPRVRGGDHAETAGRIVVLVVKRDPRDSTSQLRHMAQSTRDPSQRYESALTFLASAYYQKPEDFADELTALFGPGSRLASRLLDAGTCSLEFEQYAQRYVLPCTVRDLDEEEAAYQATYWHNYLFNPAMPGGIRVLGFRPDWKRGTADPPVTA